MWTAVHNNVTALLTLRWAGGETAGPASQQSPLQELGLLISAEFTNVTKMIILTNLSCMNRRCDGDRERVKNAGNTTGLKIGLF